MEGNNIAMAPTEEEIELELGLSIGGSYRRHARNGNVLKSEISKDMGCSEKNECCIVRSSVSPCLIGDAMQELGPKTKREMHALRRKEAKKKREEKQLKKGLCKGYSLNSSQLSNNNGGGEINNNFKNNGVWLKAKDFRISNSDERECKKIKIKAVGSDHNDDMNLNKANGKNNNSAYLPLQYGLPANGFVYPCGNVNINVMPCWFTAVSEERNAVPVVSYGFVPFQGGSGPGYHLGNGYDSEHNCGLDGGGNTKAGSNVSPLCTSFTSSDRRSSSHEGGGSSYTRSHSSPSVPEQSQLKAIETRGVSEHSETSHPGPVNESTNQVEETIQSNRDQSSPTAGPKLEPKSETESDSTEKHVSTLENPNSLEDKNKPQSENHIPPPLPHMPCVSTTGNGPNGKTINGFLYRYTKTEVSIICVCHGNSFTPAEFVQHAGGTDVSHPLRHITVIPSAF